MTFKTLIITFVSTFLFSTSNVSVDVGSLYYLELNHKGKTYYTRYGTYGMIDEDLNFYYTNVSSQKISLNDLQMREMITKGQLNIYKDINVVELKNPIDKLPNKFFSFSYGTEIAADSFEINDVYFTRLIGEGTPGEFYSERLMTDTDDWYNRIEIHQLFYIYDGELCSYQFYGNKDFYGDDELETWSNQLETILEGDSVKDNTEKFNQLIEELYKERIFYSGICSC